MGHSPVLYSINPRIYSIAGYCIYHSRYRYCGTAPEQSTAGIYLMNNEEETILFMSNYRVYFWDW